MHYDNNGTGRDSYIYQNNGGNSIYSYPSQQKKKTSINTGVKHYPSKNKHRPIGGKVLRYFNNGSGRDSYIHFD